ncbi:MAG: right-handed parallel beta-helix repeat-containing protein [Candidatus Bathyarchaeota archaeon]|nr:right-handed parallel beta-helix repeat-containing protein [Candidatus Bathyarchaeota archaeon]
MNKVLVSLAVALLCVFCMQPFLVNANFKPAPLPAIRIQSDGTLSEEIALIQRNGSVYTLLGNLTKYVLSVEYSNIVLEGSGFSVKGNGAENGITLNYVTNVTVSNFNVVDCNSGIYLNSSSENRICCNNVTESNYYCNYGIHLQNSSNSLIEGNLLIRCYFDVYLKDSGSNTLRNNHILSQQDSPREDDVGAPSGLGINFVVLGSSIGHFLNDIDESNTVNGQVICYWTEHADQTVPANAAYVALIGCRNITVQNQNLYNTQGVLLAWTTDSVVKDSYIHGCISGVTVVSSTNCTVNGNQIWGNIGGNDNGGDGVSLTDSQAIAIVGNKISGNWNAGISSTASSNSIIKENIITENWHNGISLLDGSNGNVVSLNNVYNHRTSSQAAVYVVDSQDNMVVANNLTDNGCWGMQLQGTQQNNSIYGNNFVNNSKTTPGYTRLQVSMTGLANPDVWDNGTLGNYWSDYLTRYPNASQTTPTGIGNEPFVVNANNIDHDPAMTPINISDVTPLPTPPTATTQKPPTSESSSPTPTLPADSPSPSPTVPEMPAQTAVLTLGLAAFVCALVFGKRAGKGAQSSNRAHFFCFPLFRTLCRLGQGFLTNTNLLNDQFWSKNLYKNPFNPTAPVVF